MSHPRIVLLSLVVIFCVGCARFSGGRAEEAPMPEDWQRIEFNGISFVLPPGLEDTGVQATQGVLKQYDGLQLQVNVHAGDYVSTLREFESASGSFQWLEVGGKRARGASAIIDGRAYDGLYVPDPGEGREPFSILVVSLSPEARQQGMQVLQSVRFN